MTNRQLFLWMFTFLRPVAGYAVVACATLAAWIGVEILAVRQTATAVNAIQAVRASAGAAQEGFFAWLASRDPASHALRSAVLGLAALAALLAALSYLREVARTKFSMNMVFHLREAVYDRLQRAGLGFHDRVSTGELINRALTDLQNVREFVNNAMLLTLEIALIVTGYIALLLSRSPWAALLALAPLPVWVWYILRFSRRVQPVQRSVMEAGDRNLAVLTENVAGVHVVKSFGTEPQEIAKYGRNCDEFFARVMKRFRMYANFTPVIRAIAVTSHLSLFLLAGVMIVRGGMQPGDLLVLGAAMSAILGRLQQVQVINDQYQNAIVSAKRLHEVLQVDLPAAPPPAAAPLPPGNGAVRFEDVTFGYDPARPVLHHVSFDAPGGGLIAIVGPTGAGKTTLVNLIARLYDPQKGRVVIDGVDVREIALDALRTQIAFVFQETYLFSDTVEANIAYGRPQVRGEEIEAAARIAQAHEFVEQMPRRYDTVLAERGATLSGGQRQRLAIARAILTNPRILILDDATAAVDPETEDLIHRGMQFVMRARTTFVIAHRISTVQRADLVIVLERGRVAQIGTHDELMARDGHYREIASAQLYGDEIDWDAEGDWPSHMDRMVHREAPRRNRTDATRTAEPPDEPGGAP
ncbi:MAG: ABC transporter ATP-binding protein [Phycisphaerae bacterium]